MNAPSLRTRAPRLHVDAVARLEEISPDDWRDLRAPAGLYQYPAWLAVAQDMTAGPLTYLRAASEDGRCEGIVPLYRFEPGAGGPYDPRVLLGAASADRLGASLGHAVLGGRAGYLAGWPVRQAHEPAVVAALFEAARSQTRAWSLDCLSAPFLPRAEARLLAGTGLAETDRFVAHALQAVLPLPGRDFDDYLDHLSSARASIVRRDLRRFATSGLILRHGRLGEAMDFAPDLLAQVQGRHGALADPALMARMLEAQRRRLDPLSLVTSAVTPEGQTVAYALSYIVGRGLYVRLVGLDHRQSEAAGAYFVTAYYEQIRHAYRRGLDFVHLGMGSLRPKTLRGARLEPLFGLFEGPTGALPAADAQALTRTFREAQTVALGALGAGVDWAI